MTRRLLAVVGGLVVSASLAIACQPMLDEAGSTAAPVRSAPPVVEPAVSEPAALEPSPPASRGVIERRFRGTGPEVIVLGDSLTVQSLGRLRAALDGRAVKIAALNGEGLSGGAYSEVRGLPVMERVIQEYAADRPAVVVLALGTNDVWRPDLTLAGFRTELDHLVGAFPRSCLVGVTVTETRRGLLYQRDKATALNEIIRSRSDAVVDWAKLGPSPRFTLESDHIHLTGDGARYRSELTAREVDRCLAARDGPLHVVGPGSQG